MFQHIKSLAKSNFMASTPLPYPKFLNPAKSTLQNMSKPISEPSTSQSSVECSDNCQLPISQSKINRNSAKHSGKGTGFEWNYPAFKLLIQSYASHAEELNHPSEKPHFWNNVANDLISHQYDVSSEMCHIKWNTLKQSYKTHKDNKSGRGPTNFSFFGDMDKILGNKPSNSSALTMSSLKKKCNSDKENNMNECNDDNNSTFNTEYKKKKKSRKHKCSCLSNNHEQNELKKLQMALDKGKIEVQKQRMELDKEKLQMIHKLFNPST